MMKRLSTICLVVGVMIGSTTLWAADGVLPGSGTGGDPYLIEDLVDFDEFAADPDFWASGVHTKLACDLNLIGRTYTTAVIAPDTDNTNDLDFDGTLFTGVFDGADHKIFNLTITGGSYLGLFGWIDTGGEVKNLGLENSNITGGDCLGGLCGSNFGSIINSYSNGDVAGSKAVGGLCGYNKHVITSSHTNGDVVGSQAVGGLCGFNSGSITNSYSTGTVDSSDSVGGLCGYNSGGSITKCYSSCAVNAVAGSAHGGLCGINRDGGSITDCHATGSVQGNYGTGGLCGRNYGSRIMDCYATGNVSGITSSAVVGGLCGENFVGASIANSYATGQVVASALVGGLCGSNHRDSTITNCYAIGSVSGDAYTGGLCGANLLGTITNCYSSGSVIGSDNLGGLCGANNSGAITGCFWDVETSGIGTSGDDNYGAIGKTTDEMQTLSTFIAAGWDFVGETANGTEDIWFFLQGDYPYLRWEFDPVEFLNMLVDDIIGLGLEGIGNGRGLLAKLETAIEKLSDGTVENDAAAVNSLKAFIDSVEAQSGKKIGEDVADALIAAAQLIIDLLANCGGLCACSKDIDCGRDGFVGDIYCYQENCYQDYITFECLNPGTPEAECVSESTSTLIETCAIGCAGGECVEEEDIVYIDGPAYLEEPLILNQPNTYYRLSGDLTTSGDCIRIEADGITLDLNGYTLTGDGTGTGITVVFIWNYITIKDGTIANFAGGLAIWSLTTVVNNLDVI